MKLFALIAGGVVALPLALVAARPAPNASPVAAATTWTIDPVHSTMVFKIQHMNVAPFYGRFNKLSGTVEMDDAKPENSKVELTIAADSVDTNHEGRNKHLKSPDFFNAAEFPEIKFVSKKVTKSGDKKWSVDGELSMHGVTKPLTVAVVEVGRAESKDGRIVGFDVGFQLERMDFGINYGPDSLGDEVTVMAGIECKSK